MRLLSENAVKVYLSSPSNRRNANQSTLYSSRPEEFSTQGYETPVFDSVAKHQQQLTIDTTDWRSLKKDMDQVKRIQNESIYETPLDKSKESDGSFFTPRQITLTSDQKTPKSGRSNYFSVGEGASNNTTPKDPNFPLMGDHYDEDLLNFNDRLKPSSLTHVEEASEPEGY